MSEIGKYIIIAGIIIVIIGLIVGFMGDKLSWFGDLPGDINYKKDNVRVFIPITTMILVSIILSLLFWVFRRFL